MNVLVCPSTLSFGGSERNALDLAGAMKDNGHDVTVLATPGPLEDELAHLSLRYIPIPPPRDKVGPWRPSLRVTQLLRTVLRQDSFDIVHAYESAPALEAFLGAELLQRLPLLTTIMAMNVPRRFPRSVPITVGTARLLDQCKASGHETVALLEPPIDTLRDRPDFQPTSELFHRVADEPVIAIVSRIHREMKLEGLIRAIDAVTALDTKVRARLLVVGDGPAFTELECYARSANRRLGREAIMLAGAMADPRPAYATADVVLGMGGSILRGMAFGKPAIVLGVRGFSSIVTPESVDRFLSSGFYGDGGGSTQVLASQIEELLCDRLLRDRLGAFGRELVCARFSLPRAATVLERLYDQVANQQSRRFRIFSEGVRVIAWISVMKLKQRGASLAERHASTNPITESTTLS